MIELNFRAFNMYNAAQPLAELGGVFYSIREKNFDGRGQRNKMDREFSKVAELEMEMARQREEYVLFVIRSLLDGSVRW
jgi:hypothetical protein